MRERLNRFAIIWCRLFHTEALRPMKGHYICRTCHRSYPVPWLEGEEYARRAATAARWRHSSGFAVFELQKDRG
jgi:hypothetical protein